MIKAVEGHKSVLESVGAKLLYITLALVYLWIGGCKFYFYEANNVSLLVSNSPLLSWTYSIFSIRTFADLLGVLEILIGLLLLGRFVSVKLSVVGACLSCILFIVTMSFLFSTPGVFQSGLGFPALSGKPGQFLLKDSVLFSASLFALGESLRISYLANLQRVQGTDDIRSRRSGITQ
ncbi:DUF417 family protein [Paenibacillus humicola]|uniref:DUF417 family protein n=1 Tax=Paenibacillus humicola TaxID=3110540 RepID=UPI00237C440D|nr:DUF417 family protein [Paenibacillus humicola]